jgi:CubicO group peptidase (beta-lactamase class C family)
VRPPAADGRRLRQELIIEASIYRPAGSRTPRPADRTRGRPSRTAGGHRHARRHVRNQFWIPYPDRDILLCLGIHGQMIYINWPAQLVAVRLSSWPLPQDAWKFFATIPAFDAIAAWAG